MSFPGSKLENNVFHSTFIEDTQSTQSTSYCANYWKVCKSIQNITTPQGIPVGYFKYHPDLIADPSRNSWVNKIALSI